MLTDDTLPPEGARYAAPLVLVPELWSPRDVWRRCATYLAHRGWECRLVDLRGIGGIERRAAALRDYVAALPAPPVVVGHGAGALVAREAGEGAAAIVMIAPLAAGAPPTRALVLDLRNLLQVAFGRPVAAPVGQALALLVGSLPPAERAAVVARLAPDDGAALRDLLRGRVALGPLPLPTLVVGGERDPLLASADARALGARLGADVELLPGAGHWLLAGDAWQRAVAVIHRWIVQRLGEPLLETYAEAMADREEADDD